MKSFSLRSSLPGEFRDCGRIRTTHNSATPCGITPRATPATAIAKTEDPVLARRLIDHRYVRGNDERHRITPAVRLTVLFGAHESGRFTALRRCILDRQCTEAR